MTNFTAIVDALGCRELAMGDMIDEFLAAPTRENFIRSVYQVVRGNSKGPANIDRIAHLITAFDSAAYAMQHMQGKPRFANRPKLLQFAASQAFVKGLVLEFGVFSGTTINLLADCFPDQKLYGFDSFQGLPEDWNETQKKGHFALEKLPSVRANVELVAGWFNETLPDFVKKHREPVSFLHVDCDLYSSTKTVLHELRHGIVPGTIIVFDEYLNYTNWRDHEYKAFAEFCAEFGVEYEYIGVVPDFEQAAVMITDR